MTTTLPPFSGSRPTCPKCGHHEARTTWRPEDQLCSCRTPTGIGERLCRECWRCSYHWNEALAVHADTTPEAERLPLGQQFDIRTAYGMQASSVLVTHPASGLHKVLRCGNPAAADAATVPLYMFQALLDDVDAWGRQPIGASCAPAAEETEPNNLEQP
jgi:hypothetical protein